MEWKNTCEALWGDDWIAPLSEVLRVNRRTVERWKSGEIEPPQSIVAELVRLPRIGSAQRAYGTMLRRLSRGETLRDIEDSVASEKRAFTRLRADIGRYSAISVLAYGPGDDVDDSCY